MDNKEQEMLDRILHLIQDYNNNHTITIRTNDQTVDMKLKLVAHNGGLYLDINERK